MIAKPIRLMVVVAQEGKAAVQDFVNDLEGVEIVGIAYNVRSATQLLERTKPDVVLVDMMLRGLRSIDIVSYASQRNLMSRYSH
jgi:response regulator of citrate/malate metabolism